MKHQFYSIVSSQAEGKATMTISGYLNPWENASKDLVREINQLAANFKEIDIILMNCYGGSVYEGIPTYNAIKNCKVKVNTIIDGLAASMGGILFLAGHKRYMAKMSRLMIHKVTGGAYGDSDTLRHQADVMDSLESDLIGIVAEISAMEKEEVKTLWFQKGKDTYLTAEEAIGYKLVDGTIEGNIKADLPSDILNQGEKPIWDFYNQQIQNSIQTQNTKPEMEKLAFIIAALGLAKNASEENVLEAVNKLNSENKRLSDELETEKKKNSDAQNAMVTNYVEAALGSGKITAAEKDTFIKLGMSDFDSVKKIVDSRPAHKSLSETIENGKEKDKYADWDFKRFQREAPKILENIKKTDPDRFKKLKDEYLASRNN